MSEAARRRRTLDAARTLLQARRIDEAEQLLLAGIAQARRDAVLLHALAALYADTGRPREAAQVLERLVEIAPHESRHYLALAALRQQLGEAAALAGIYQRMVAALPDSAIGHFNLGCALRARGEDTAALAAHRRALALGIEQPEEVWSNIAAILGDLQRHAEAREALERALALNPRWIPALYNLGLWHEEHGELARAEAIFERILALDPQYHDALSRLANLGRAQEASDPLIARLEVALRQPALVPLVREGLEFALGKRLDDCGRYEEAFAHYRAGNALSRQRVHAYDRAATTAWFRRVRECFDGGWFTRCAAVSERPLLFIVGMFRSGTTLLEQMLSVHPALVAGGEIDYWNVQLRGDSGFPERAAADAGWRQLLAEGYLAQLDRDHPSGLRVCDKRPDNFAYLGLIAALFPRARFLHTRRDPRDTCLSIYFQQLEDRLGYAADLADTAHYLGEYRALMRHWQGLLGERILDIDYERLVSAPGPEMQRVCGFLGIPWHEGMLHFHASPNRVRTASVGQVREPLYARAVGRWHHYATHLGPLAEEFAEDHAGDD